MSQDLMMTISRAPHTPDADFYLNLPVLRQQIEARLATWVFDEELVDRYLSEIEEPTEAELADEFRAWLATHVTPERLSETTGQPIEFLMQLFSIEWDEAADALETARVQRALHDWFWICYDSIGEYDVLWTKIEGMPYWITGGMSGGDDPTDTFSYLAFIADTGVMYEAFELPAGIKNERVPETTHNI